MKTDDMIRALPYWKTKDGKLTMIKNMKTREYQLKKKLFEKRYKPMTITEVGR